MPYPSQMHLNARSGSTWRLGVGLVLLCGFITWSLAAPPTVFQLGIPLLINQVEELELAGSPENLRARPTLHRDGVTPNDKESCGSDGSSHAQVCATFSESGSSTQAAVYIFSSYELPTSSRYTLPASREPPKA